MGELFNPVHLVVLFVALSLWSPLFFNVLSVPPFWRTFKRAGFAPALSLLMVLPIVNLIVLYVVSYSNREVFGTFAIDPELTYRDATVGQPSTAALNFVTRIRELTSFGCSSEGVRRLSIAAAVLASVTGLFIIGANLIPNSESAIVLLPVLIGSAFCGLAAWGLVRLVDWTAIGFRSNRLAQIGDSRMSKYDPLYKYLATQKGSPVTMTFSQVEKVLGFALPASARKYAAWWANANPESGQHPYSQAWTLAGMRASVNVAAEQVVFEKSE
jgi:hypothetical protein